MLGRKRQEDGPFFRAAQRRADAVDKATTPAERRKAVALLIPTTLVAFAEGFLREFFALLALLACVGAIISGATSDRPGWVVGLVAAGVAGAALVLVALVRRWSFGWQWSVYVGVLVIEGALIAAADKMPLLN